MTSAPNTRYQKYLEGIVQIALGISVFEKIADIFQNDNNDFKEFKTICHPLFCGKWQSTLYMIVNIKPDQHVYTCLLLSDSHFLISIIDDTFISEPTSSLGCT